MKRLTILFALFIVCDLSFNTAFAQDVRQKPVVKKQTTTTTKQSASTKKSATNTKQKQVTTNKWKEQEEFREGRAYIEDADDKWGYIDKTGKIVK